MSYNISDYSLHRAKQLKVHIEPSKDGKHKIDVYDLDGKYITSIGAIGYPDFPTYISTHGLDVAMEKRKNYKSRHEKDRHVPKSRGFYADTILW